VRSNRTIELFVVAELDVGVEEDLLYFGNEVQLFGFPAVGAILAIVDPLLPPGEDS
jgi:hypothetical protein